MAIREVQVNTVSPYLVLSKHERIPTLLTISNSEEVENDIKVSSAHKVHTLSCITTLKTTNEIIPVPEALITQNINVEECDIIKTGDLSITTIKTLAKKVKQCEKSLICNASNLSSSCFNDLINNLGLYINVLVLDTNNMERDFSSLKDVIAFGKDLAVEKKIKNILLLNFAYENKFINILYQSNENKVLTFQAEISFSTDSISTLTTAMTSNIANNYNLSQAVYGALEFTQTATLLTKENIEERLNLVHNIYIPLNNMVKDECFTAHELVTQSKLIDDKSITHQFLEYLNEHPYVRDHWSDYVNHDFVKQVAESRLNLQQFKFYIEQDYNYLADYARFHCISAAKSPDLIDIEKELYVLGRIKDSMNCHKKRLRDYFDVTDEHHMEKVERSDALNKYTRYMGDIARRGNWRELIAALAPCMVGYCTAVAKYVGKTEPEPGTIYRDWTDFYSTLPLEESIGKGAYFLNHIAQTCPQKELNYLIKIYGDVCRLEANFWDSPLERTFDN